MELKALKAQRKGLRILLANAQKKMETILIEPIDIKKISILKKQLKDKFERLSTIQEQISNWHLQTEYTEEVFLNDLEEAEHYRDSYLEICTRVDLKLQEIPLPCETEKAKNYPKAIKQLTEQYKGEPMDTNY